MIITHSGVFHADEVMAIAMIMEMYNGEDEVHRMREVEAWHLEKEGVWVVDIGGDYAPNLRNFDHHQREGAGSRENRIPYASAGLILKYLKDDEKVTITNVHGVGFRLQDE